MIICEEEDKGSCNSAYCVIFLQQIHSERVYIRMQAKLRVILQGIKDLSRSETVTAVLCDM
jgi:hypothetical protein